MSLSCFWRANKKGVAGRDGCLGGERENENENETKPAEVVCRVDWLLFVSRDRLCLGLLGCFSSRHFVSERSASSGYQREVEGIAHFNSAALCVRSEVGSSVRSRQHRDQGYTEGSFNNREISFV